MSTANINSNEIYFECKQITKIRGEPTFEKLHEMFCEIKVNASAVPSTLRGEANEYLGILVSAAKYTTVVPTTPFLSPSMLRPLVIYPDFTQYQSAKIAYSFGSLKSSSLISIGQLCDNNCIAIFSKYDVHIIKHNEIL